MNTFLKYSLRFIALMFIQTLILNQLELGWGIQLMVYPLLLVLLPFDIDTIPLMGIAFLLGFGIDAMSNTYGLHTSSIVLLAYMRPIIYKMYAPRDGYENFADGNIYEMGTRWFVFVYGSMLIIHHLWFFTMEIFRITDFFFIMQKTLLSLPLSFILSLLVQALFVAKPKER